MKRYTHVQDNLKVCGTKEKQQVLINTIEIVQRRAARFCNTDFKTIETRCISEMIEKLNINPSNIRVE